MSKNRTRRSLVALTLALGVATSATPALAAPSPSPSTTTGSSVTPTATPSATPTTTPTAAPTAPQLPVVATIPVSTVAPSAGDGTGILGVGSAEMAALGDRYSSLSGALVWFYAGQQGMSVGSYMQQNPTQAASLLGLSDAQQLASLPADLGTNSEGQSDLGTLNNQLAAAGLTVDASSYESLDEYAAAVSSNASSIDAAVVNAGAGWAKQLGTLRTPALSTPNMPGVNTSMATSMPKEGLMFGMFLNKSLTSLITDHPSVFAQVQQSGLGTPAAQQAWQQSMQKALAGSQADYASMLPSQSGAALLAAMASGDPKAASRLGIVGQGSCVTAGLYLNAQMGRLFSPSATSTLPNANDNVISPTEYGNLQDWQRKLIEQQNPNLSSSLQQSMGNSTSTGCAAASTSTKGALSVTLPGVFANLTR